MTYTNSRGLSLNLAPYAPYDLFGCDDDYLDNEIISEPLGFDHGEEFISNILSPRRIEITGRLNTVTFRREMRREMQRIFNPTLKGTLAYHNAANDMVYTIECIPSSLSAVAFERTGVYFTINLICLYPFYRGSSVIEHISLINKRGYFPLVFPEDEGFIFGYRADTLQTTFENLGDAAAGATYVLTADGGTVTNPSMTHLESGRTVKINYPMQDGDIIKVISMPAFAGIRINDNINGMQHLEFNPKGNFFILDFGLNTIAYDADENATNLSVSVFYDPVYLGVQ